MKKIKKSFWGAYWKLHDKKKMLVARLRGYLDGLPPKTRRRIVLAMLAAFAVLALYTFGKAVYEIGRNDGRHGEKSDSGPASVSGGGRREKSKPHLRPRWHSGERRILDAPENVFQQCLLFAQCFALFGEAAT